MSDPRTVTNKGVDLDHFETNKTMFNLWLNPQGHDPRDWQSYRLGDGIKNGNFQHHFEGCRTDYFGGNLVDASTTILCQYHSRTRANLDYDVIEQIINEYPPALSPRRGELVVHLRLGDTLLGSNCWDDINDCFHDKLFHLHYAYPRVFYDRLLKDLEQIKSKRMTIVTNPHHSHRTLEPNKIFEHDWKYLLSVRRYFIQRGFRVTVRDLQTPDEDLVFMSRAAFFIRAGGGYSGIISQLVKRRGGVVFQPEYCPGLGCFSNSSRGTQCC
jgi:hypothetical protein